MGMPSRFVTHRAGSRSTLRTLANVDTRVVVAARIAWNGRNEQPLRPQARAAEMCDR